MSWLSKVTQLFYISPRLNTVVLRLHGCFVLCCPCHRLMTNLAREACQWCFKHKCLNIWYSMILIVNWDTTRPLDCIARCRCNQVTLPNLGWFVCFRRREHLPLESVVTRRTACAGVADPKPTICRSPPAESVAIPRSARESVRMPHHLSLLLAARGSIAHSQPLGPPLWDSFGHPLYWRAFAFTKIHVCYVWATWCQWPKLFIL